MDNAIAAVEEKLKKRQQIKEKKVYFRELIFTKTGLQLRVCIEKLIFLFLNQNICCGYSKELSQ